MTQQAGSSLRDSTVCVLQRATCVAFVVFARQSQKIRAYSHTHTLPDVGQRVACVCVLQLWTVAPQRSHVSVNASRLPPSSTKESPRRSHLLTRHVVTWLSGSGNLRRAVKSTAAVETQQTSPQFLCNLRREEKQNQGRNQGVDEEQKWPFHGATR